VFGKQFQLRKLFLNLISSSIKFIKTAVAPLKSISGQKVTSENLNFASQKIYKIVVKDN
jgi:hypothetical protein